MRLLVADRDPDMAEVWSSWLRMRGYQVKCALNVGQLRSMWIRHKPDLTLADIDLPGGDALDACRDLQRIHDALVLALTTNHTPGPDDAIQCLEHGADAYLVKPFFPAELLAHIHALARRMRDSLERSAPSTVQVGEIFVDALRHEATIGVRTIRLTPIESKLLHLLALNANNVCTLEYIVAHVWGFNYESDTMTLIKPHIRHLREKVEQFPSRPQIIVTVTGSGYMLARQPGETTTEAGSLEHEDATDTIGKLAYDPAMAWTLAEP